MRILRLLAATTVLMSATPFAVAADPSMPVAKITTHPLGNSPTRDRPFTIDGSSSTPSDGATITDYAWDFNDDGLFEVDTGTSPTVTHTWTGPQPEDVPVALRVTDSTGATAEMREVMLLSCYVDPEMPTSVTINDEDPYTDTPHVTVDIDSTCDSTVELSNDGGFHHSKTFSIPYLGVRSTARLPWTLLETGQERLPKTVYVRFGSDSKVNADPNKVFQDDIILDQTAPVLTSASATSAGAASPNAAGIKKVPPLVTFHVKAKDALSGVGGVQITTNRRSPGKVLRYSAKVALHIVGRTFYVRAVDRAGNRSSWKLVVATR